MVPSGRGHHLGRGDGAALGLQLHEERVGRGLRRIAEDQAVTLQAVDRRERQPVARKNRPGAHGDDDRIARQLLPVHHDAPHGAIGLLHHAADGTDGHARTFGERRPHHGAGEGGGVELCRGLGCAEARVDRRAAREPVRRRELAVEAHVAPRAADDAERVEPAVPPLVVDALGKLRVEREAAARQRLDRRAVAPVEREEAARLAGGRIGDAGALDHRALDAALAEEVGDRRADHAATADQYPHARLAVFTPERMVVGTASPIA